MSTKVFRFLGYDIVSMDDTTVSIRITSQTHRNGLFEKFTYRGKSSGHLYSLESDLYPAWWEAYTNSGYGRQDPRFKLFLRGRSHNKDNDTINIPIKHWPDVRDMIELYNGFALPPELFNWEG